MNSRMNLCRDGFMNQHNTARQSVDRSIQRPVCVEDLKPTQTNKNTRLASLRKKMRMEERRQTSMSGFSEFIL